MRLFFTQKQLEQIKNDLKKEAIREYIESLEYKRKTVELAISQRASSAVNFNFDDTNVIAFSIERLDHNTLNERTVVGYYLRNEAHSNSAKEEKVIKEWTLLCSREQHNALVKNFNEANSKRLMEG